jgi:ABC-type Fe3+-siderophore transport system permease subunit
MATLELFIPIVAIVFSHSLIFGVLFIYLRNRNRERMQMIEKGVDPSIFIQKPKNSLSVALKYGLFLIGIAVGILMGAVLDETTSIADGAAYISMILLFGGLGLIVYYLIDKKNDRSTNG